LQYERRAIEKIRSIIDERGIKQRVIAKKCGYTDQMFSDLLNGRKRLTLEGMVAICAALETSPDELLDFTDNVAEIGNK
jgi:transcriptional regulator with XRE-family HTH domain